MDAKPWYESKTIWANAIIVIVAILTLATEQLDLPAEQVKVLLFLAGSLGIVLRFLTNQPVTTRKPD